MVQTSVPEERVQSVLVVQTSVAEERVQSVLVVQTSVPEERGSVSPGGSNFSA